MGNISRRAMLGATGGLIAGGLLKTQADALTVEAETAPPANRTGGSHEGARGADQRPGPTGTRRAAPAQYG